MQMRLLFAAPDASMQQLLRNVLSAALCFTPLDVIATTVESKTDLLARLGQNLDDVVLLDWNIADEDTPALVTQILEANPALRVVTLLPEQMRQYRQQVWDAGACNGIPKECMDQEWLSTVLCIMYRAMEREAKLIHAQS